MTIRARDLLQRGGDALQLEALTGEVGLDRVLPDADLASPGLVLAGYTGRFVPDRIHVLGETEITYLASLDAESRRASLETFFSYDLPLVIITKGDRSGVEGQTNILKIMRVGEHRVRSND